MHPVRSGPFPIPTPIWRGSNGPLPPAIIFSTAFRSKSLRCNDSTVALLPSKECANLAKITNNLQLVPTPLIKCKGFRRCITYLPTHGSLGPPFDFMLAWEFAGGLAIERRWLSPSGITPENLSVHCHEYGAGGATQIFHCIHRIVQHRPLGSVELLLTIPGPSCLRTYCGARHSHLC